MASPMRPPANRLLHPAYHNLDLAVVTRVVLGDNVAEPAIVLPGPPAR